MARPRMAKRAVPRDTVWSDPELDSSQRAQLVVQRHQRLRNDYSTVLWNWDRYQELYHNVMPNVFGSDPIGSLFTVDQQSLSAGLAVNVISRGVDTIVSRLKKNKSRPRFVTSNAKDALKRRALGLQQFTDGVLYDQGWQRKAEMVLRDMALLGTGCVKAWDDHEEGRVRVEPIPIAEVFIGRVAGLSKDPAEAMHARVVSRREMMARFPEHAIGIRSSPGLILDGQRIEDAVLAIDAYSYEPWNDDEESQGRHVMVVGQQWVVDDPWSQPVPFLFCRWKMHSRFFHGTGIASDLLSNQIKIKNMLEDLVFAVHSFGMPAIFVQRGSNPTRETFTDAIGRVVEYDGPNPPQVAAPTNVVANQVMQTIQWMIDDSFDQIGMSQMMATGTKEAGLDSGVAIREMNDTQSDRFTSVASAWDELHVQLGQRVVEAGKRLYSKGSKVRLLGSEGDMSHVDWGDIDMEDDSYQLQVFSASTMPTSPAGRLQYVQEMLASGFIGQQQAAQLVGDPDTFSAVRLGTASYRAAQRQVEMVIDGADDLSPDEYMDADTCARLANQAYNDVMSRPDPDEAVLERLRDYMRAIAAEQAPPPQPAAPQLPPDAAAGPPAALGAPLPGPMALPPGPPPPMPPGPPGVGALL